MYLLPHLHMMLTSLILLCLRSDVVHGIISNVDDDTNKTQDDIKTLFKNAETVLFAGPASKGG